MTRDAVAEAGAGVWGIVLGGGSGQRFGAPKQFLEIAGRSLLDHSAAAARTVCTGLVLVVPNPDDVPPETAALSDLVVEGGADRAGSVRAGLAAVPPHAEVIVIADAAHPLASPALYAAVVAALREGADGAFPGLPLTEVVARLGPDGDRVGDVSRQGLVLVQMPQAFRAGALRAVHTGHTQAAVAVEDSAMVAGLVLDGRPARVVSVPGEPANIHVTVPAELEMARALATVVTAQ